MYPIQAPEQLAAYLRALRTSKGLTQAGVGRSLGVSAARISEIEKDPANVGFGQIQRLLLVLGARLVLEETNAGTKRSSREKAPRGQW
jgi:transcriptional regulator with XRE-family HTH domain